MLNTTTTRVLTMSSKRDFDDLFVEFIETYVPYRIVILLGAHEEYIPVGHAFFLGSPNTAGAYTDCLGRTIIKGGRIGGQMLSSLPSNYIQLVILINCNNEDFLYSYREECREGNVQLVEL